MVNEFKRKNVDIDEKRWNKFVYICKNMKLLVREGLDQAIEKFIKVNEEYFG